MKCGLVLLSAKDVDAPTLCAIASVGKDDPTDDGGYAIAKVAAAAGSLWIDRPYFVGNPSVVWLVGKGQQTHAVGGLTQVGNEPNNSIEGWSGGPSAYTAFWQAVNVAAPAVPWLHAPLSPSIDGWQSWVTPGCARYAVHAYGTNQQMQSVIEWYLQNTGGDLYVTECNFGAGQAVDVASWVANEFAPFLAWCQTQPRVKLVTYFAWRWNQSPTLPVSVDAAVWPSVISALQEVQPMDPTTQAELTALQAQVATLQSQVATLTTQLATSTATAQMIENQNTILTNMWKLFRQGQFSGAGGIDGAIVEMQGGQPLGFQPNYPPLP